MVFYFILKALFVLKIFKYLSWLFGYISIALNLAYNKNELSWLFGYISIALNLAYNKNELYETLDYWSRDMLNFDFWENGLGIVSPPHFVYEFSRRMFLLLYSINWPNSIVWLSLLLEMLGNMCIAINSFPGCDVINSEINLL